MKLSRIVASALLLAVLAAPAWAQDRKPNIVFILADDMGYGDPQCYNSNSKIPTPHIDRLAKEGMRFTDAHAPAAVCVPTRYGLLSGRYPFRRKGGKGPLLEEGRLTLASLLQQQGYHTGMVGKWHLRFHMNGYDKPLKGGPVDRGFDSFFGMHASLDIPPYYYIEGDRAVQPPTESIEASSSEGVTRIQGAFWRAGKIAPNFKHREVLPKWTGKATAFIDDHLQKSPDKPFFLYLALTAPHTPWLPTEPFEGQSKAGDYGDFTHQVDATVGQVLAALDRHNIADDTLVMFTSDNGPVWYDQDVKRYGHNCVGPLRGMKGDAWEGGHRMPFVARWPKQIPAGSESDEVICLTDMMATYAAILDVKLPEDAGEDSYNILPVLLGKKRDAPVREATVFQSSGGVLAIRQGAWKLIPALGSGGFSQPRRVKPEPDGPQGQLYNLAEDLGEQNNLWKEHPEIVKRLAGVLAKYKREGRSVAR